MGATTTVISINAHAKRGVGHLFSRQRGYSAIDPRAAPTGGATPPMSAKGGKAVAAGQGKGQSAHNRRESQPSCVDFCPWPFTFLDGAGC